VTDGIEFVYPRYLFPPRGFRSWYGPLFLACARPAFERALAEFQPDVIYTPWAYPDGWAAVELGHRAGLPVVITVRGSDVLLAHSFRGRAQRTAEALRRADAVVAISRDLAQHVLAFGTDPRRVQVICHGIDPASFYPGPREEARARLRLSGDEPLILSIGNFVPVKGTDVLIEACARLAHQGLRFQCCLIGDGTLRRCLEEQIARLGVGERVRLLGRLPNEKLPDWYRSAHVFALASYSEGIPSVLLEAAACGTPFVATRVGGIPEVADLGVSRLVAPGDPAALAEALAAFVTAPPGQHKAPAPFRRSHADVASELLGVFQQAIQSYTATTLAPGSGGRPGMAPAAPPDSEPAKQRAIA
jgi:glycosyltransferase involved in cell wall biosynthesis